MEPGVLLFNQDHCLTSDVRGDIPIIQMTPTLTIIEPSDLPHSRIPALTHQHIQRFQYSHVEYGSNNLMFHQDGLPSYLPNQGEPNSTGHTVRPAYLRIAASTPVIPLESVQPCSSVPNSSRSFIITSPPPLMPNDDSQYYHEIESYLATGQWPVSSSEAYRVRLADKAQHYQIIDGILYHSKKNPKRVVIKKDEQNDLMLKTHIISDSGVHRGVKKMFDILKAQVFWRGMYQDIVKFLKDCSKCSEVGPLSSSNSDLTNDTFKEEDQSVPSLNSEEKTVQTQFDFWKTVEVEIHEISRQSGSEGYDCILTLCDPVSHFVTAWPIISQQDCDSVFASRIVSVFALLGLPESVTVVPNDLRFFQKFVDELDRSIKFLAPQIRVIVSEGPSSTVWLKQLLDLLISTKPDLWHLELEKYMYNFRLGGTGKSSWNSPFRTLFNGRNSIHIINEEQKENIAENIFSRLVFDDEELSGAEDDNSFGCSSNVRAKEKNNGQDYIDFKPSEDETKLTVKELKSFLSQIKQSRRKRGKYNKYSPELQERMIEFAKKRGSHKASKHFTKLLRTHVSESTIRNLIRAQLNLHPLAKEEIGNYAYSHGPEKACRHFSAKLHINLPMNLVRKLQTIYVNRLMRKRNEEAAKRRLNIDNLSEKVKQDIGHYASNHTSQETVSHFMEKGIEVDEEVVKEIMQYYLQINHYSPFPGYPNNTTLSSGDSSPLKNLNQTPSCSDYGILNLINHLHSNGNVGLAKTDSSCSSKVSCPDKDHNYSSKNQQNNLDSSSSVDDELEEIPETVYHAVPSKPAKKRGHYSSYSPELRAEIGKFAAEHGPLKASAHFTAKLGRDIPESTARSLSDKYMNKIAKSKEVTSLGFGRRGRPLRLGKYDQAVQDCLRELVRSGEKVTSFLAITTAKQIVSKYEPYLLKENGGRMDLNVTWAKSILKRLGVRNNS